jgi:hypothetical protein
MFEGLGFEHGHHVPNRDSGESIGRAIEQGPATGDMRQAGYLV